jgi:mannosyltransferase OCH1-like enzyme
MTTPPPSQNAQGINIIQTWKTYDMNATHYELVMKMRQNNPDANHMFFDDEQILNFVGTVFPQYKDIFNGFPYKIQQIDFFRYLAIYHFGGIYLDLDMDIYRCLDVFQNKTVCSFPIENYDITQNMLIGNYAFYAPKGHPFIWHIIDTIVNAPNIDDVIKERQMNHTDNPEHVMVYVTTGPELVTRAYNTYLNRPRFELENPVSPISNLVVEPYEQIFKGINNGSDDVELLNPSSGFRRDCFGDFGVHYSFGSWK